MIGVSSLFAPVTAPVTPQYTYTYYDTAIGALRLAPHFEGWVCVGLDGDVTPGDVYVNPNSAYQHPDSGWITTAPTGISRTWVVTSAWLCYRKAPTPAAAPQATSEWVQVMGADAIVQAGDVLLLKTSTADPGTINEVSSFVGHGGVLAAASVGKPFGSAVWKSDLKTLWRRAPKVGAPVTAAPPQWTQLSNDHVMKEGDVVLRSGHTDPSMVKTTAGDQTGWIVKGAAGASLGEWMSEGFATPGSTLWRKTGGQATETAAPAPGDETPMVWIELADPSTCIEQGDVALNPGYSNPADHSLKPDVDNKAGWIINSFYGTAYKVKDYHASIKGRTVWRKVSVASQWIPLEDYSTTLAPGDVFLPPGRFNPWAITPSTPPKDGSITHLQPPYCVGSVKSAYGVSWTVWRKLAGGATVSATRSAGRLPGNRHFGKPLPLP